MGETRAVDPARLKRIQYRPDLLTSFLTHTGRPSTPNRRKP